MQPRDRRRSAAAASRLRTVKVLLGCLLAVAAWWAAANIAVPQPLEDDYHLLINLFQRRMYVFDVGERARMLPLTAEAGGLPPPGVYPVVRRMTFDVRDPAVQRYLGIHWLGLGVPGDSLSEDGLRYGIHGVRLSAQAPAGSAAAPAPGLPRRDRRGACIGLANVHLAELHDATPPGTRVYIYWGLPWHDIFHSLPFGHPFSPGPGEGGCRPPVVTVQADPAYSR